MTTRGAALALAMPAAALAHEGEPLAPHDLWRAWEFEPATLIALAVAAFLYARGTRRARGFGRRETVCFWTGWVTLGLALCSPLHRLGSALFAAHMVQHEILMIVSAPLLAMGRPLAAMLWGLPRRWRRVVGRWAKAHPLADRPFRAWLVHGMTLWLWHAPALFQATLTSDLAHALQHTSFLFSAVYFWWAMLQPRTRTGSGAGVLYVFTTAAHTSILGALLTFSPRVWYPAYGESAPLWGWTALEDQQAGGLIMWIPAGLVYLAAGLALFATWIGEGSLLGSRRRYAE